MAPFIGPSRKQLLAILRGRPTPPITLGKYEPQAVVVKDGSSWRIRQLELDPDCVRALEAEGPCMPEHYFQCLRPGRILIEADELVDFCGLIERMDWTFGP